MQFSHINILTPGLDRGSLCSQDILRNPDIPGFDRDILTLGPKNKKRIKRGYAFPANFLAIESINAVSSPPFTISTATNA